jgi:hypothetical protein
MKLLFGSFLLIGSICLSITALIYNSNSDFEKNALTTTGIVTKNFRSRSMSYPNVSFIDESGNERQFKSRYGQSPAQYDLGEEVTVLYPKSRPEKARIKPFSNFGLGGVITGSIGLVFFLVGFFVLLSVYRRQYHQWWAKKYGQEIKALISKIAQDKSFVKNLENPWVIEAKWRCPQTRKTYHFLSNHYWKDPHLKLQTNQEVVIFIDPKNPTRYFMQEQNI